MNIGQILEIHLSWACHMLGEEIKEAKTDPVKAKALEKRLREAGYDFDTYGMPESTESGVHIATPVFDGCRDEDLAATLAAAGDFRSMRNPIFMTDVPVRSSTDR